MKKTVGFFLFFLILLSGLLFSSDKSFIRFDQVIPEIDGKAILGISSIIQDREGFLWFGTGRGLIKYDGTSYTLFRHDPDDEKSISVDQIFPLFEDSQGVLWIGTNGGGLNRYEKGKNGFTRYRHDPEKPDSLSDDIVLSIAEDLLGNLWVGTRFGGLVLFDRDSETFSRVDLNGPDFTPMTTGAIWSLFTDRDGFVWIGTGERGAIRINPETMDTVKFIHDPDDPGSIGANSVWAFFEDEVGDIWLGTNLGGLNRYNKGNDTFVRYFGDEQAGDSLASCNITAIHQDRQGNLWIGTARIGLKIFNIAEKTLVSYKNVPDDPESLSGNIITSLWRDKEGVMWVGTAQNGIDKCLSPLAKFAHFKHNPNNPRSLTHNNIKALGSDIGGNIWVGTDKGLERLAAGDAGHKLFVFNPSNENGLSHNDIRALVFDDNDTLWIGTYGGGLCSLNPGTGRFSVHKKQQGVTIADRVNVLHLDKMDKGILWVGTESGLCRYDTQNKHVTCFKHIPDDPNSLSGNQILSIHEDHEGNLWVGTRNDGLNKLDKKLRIWKRFVYDPAEPIGLSQRSVTAVCEGEPGVLWIGTEGGGLNRYIEADNSWKVFTEADGLPGSLICGILEDSQGCIWLSSNRGITRMDPETGLFTNFERHDGLQSYTFNAGAVHESRDGKFFFGGVNGFNVFFPSDLEPNPFVPPVRLKAYYQHGRYVQLDRPASSPLGFVFSSSENFISFEFTALSYVSPDKNQYAYFLEGESPDWILLGSDRLVSFTRLPRGDYTLRVRASNADGIWGEEGMVLHFKVKTSIWRTGLFRTLLLFILIGIVATVFRMRKRMAGISHPDRESLEDLFEKRELTGREQEILLLLIEGKNNKDIGNKLFISENTVRNHVYNIYRKLNVKNRLELINKVKRVIREGKLL